MLSTELESLKASTQTKTRRSPMSTFFKHVELHKYDITERDLLRACVDELVASGYDILSEEELNLLARHKLEKFKDYMRPLFA